MGALQTAVVLDRVRFYAFHGVMEQERRVGGWFTVSLRADVDFSAAFATDDVAATVSYADLYELVAREMAVPSRLLEHVAGRILRAVTTRFPQVTALQLRIMKLNPPMGADCDGAGVCVELRIEN